MVFGARPLVTCCRTGAGLIRERFGAVCRTGAPAVDNWRPRRIVSQHELVRLKAEGASLRQTAHRELCGSGLATVTAGFGTAHPAPNECLLPCSALSASCRRDVLLLTIASDTLTFGTNRAAQVAKHVVQRPDHESLFFSLLLQFTSSCGDLGSSRLDNVVR